MDSEIKNENEDRAASQSGTDVKRRGLLRFGTLVTALTGASAISAVSATSTQAAPDDAFPTNTYVPVAEKGSPSGVASLDVNAKILPTQLPDFSASYANGIQPESYGTTGDGTPYDQTPIGQAINALGTTGGLVRLKAKSYRLGTRLRMNKTGLMLAGDGPAATILNLDAAGFEVMASNVTIRDLTIRGDGTRSLFQLVTTGAFKNWSFINVVFEGVAVVPSRLGATIGDGGIITSGAGLSEHVEFDHCEFTGYRGDASLHIRGTHYVTVNTCYFHDAGMSTSAGDLCKASAGAAHTKILDSVFRNGTRDAIDLFDAHQALVRGNTIDNMGVHGIEMKAVSGTAINPADRHQILGNRIFRTSQVSTSAPAVQCAVPNVMLEGNQISGGRSVGIRAGKTTDNITRAKNHIIIGNLIFGQGSHGFMGDDLDASVVSGNISHNNGTLTGVGAGFWYYRATGIAGKAAMNISYDNVTADRWPAA